MTNIYALACYNTFEKSFILDCVESIKDNDPNSIIQISDSDSPDKSYIDLAEKFPGVTVSDCRNRNYAFGGYWNAFKQNLHRREALFICIHDSAIVRTNFSDDIYHNQLFTPIWYWEDKTLVPGGNTYEWTKNNIAQHTKYTAMSPYCIYGGCFVAHASIMYKFMLDGVSKCVPTDKQSSANADEHLWATACLNNGIHVNECAVAGTSESGINKDTDPIWKFAGHKVRS